MVETVLLVFLGVFSLVYLWTKRHYSYWRRRGLPQPPITPFCGNMLDNLLNRKSIGTVFDEIYKSYPQNDAVGVYGLFTPKLFLRNPRLIQKVLVSDFSSFHDNEFYVLKKVDPQFYEDPFCLKGEEWKPARSKLMSTLTVGRVKEIFPVMKETLGRLDSYLKENLGKDIDAKMLSTLFTMDNVSKCVFGIDSNCFTDDQAAFRRMGDTVMKDSLQTLWKTVVVTLMPRVRDLIGLRVIPKSVGDFIEKIVQDVMEHRIKNNITRGDLFQYFMKKGMDSKDCLKELIFFGSTFFLEAFETSAMAASHVLYELALNQDVQQRLYEELKSAFGEKFDPYFDTISNLTYLDSVIQESQRKCPALYLITRLCTKQTVLEIDGKYVKIEPGTPVVMPVLSLHLDPRFYADPEKFDPERFNDVNKSSRPACTFLPFGDGPRMCPGTKFALVQVKLLIANIVFKYKILKSENTPERLTFSSSAFMVVPNETEWIVIEERK